MTRNLRLQGFIEFILNYLNQLLEEKLAHAKDEEQRAKFRRKFDFTVWLEDAVNRVLRLKIATHQVKAIHTGASGSSLLCPPESLSQSEYLGSHALAENFALDVVGDAAALDVYKFLRQPHEGRPLLEWLEAGDPDALAALDPDPEKAAALAEAFLSLKKSPKTPASHTLAKQIYWPAGDEPADDGQFHLLAPLYPSSLVQAVFQKVQDDQFGEKAEAARKARKAGAWHEDEARYYPDLAIQKIGGANPQNAGQLNSERRGNHLFPSVPPVWAARGPQPPKGHSLFSSFGRRQGVRQPLLALKFFLGSNPPANRETRKRRDIYLNEIIDEFMAYAAELKSLPPGWTKEAACRLPQEEKDWLEPDFRDLTTSPEQPDETVIIHSFANWLNARLEKALPVGDVEQAFWADSLNLALKEADLD
jgi:CRISPR-associated protein Csy1